MVVERTVSETWVMANGRGITLIVGMIADAMFQRHSSVEARQGIFSERHLFCGYDALFRVGCAYPA